MGKHAKPFAVQVSELRLGYFPKHFILDDKEFKVLVVERTVTSHKQYEFQVRCDDGETYRLVQNLRTKEWTCLPIQLKRMTTT